MRLKHKYNAVPTTVDNIRFDSKLEAAWYRYFMLDVKAGHMLGMLRQAPLHLPGGVTYRLDFLLFWANGRVEAVEIKGMMTPAAKLKMKLAKEFYPWMPIRTETKPPPIILEEGS